MRERRIQEFRTSGTTAPTSDMLLEGEVALGLNPDKVRIWFKDTDNTVHEFVDKTYVDSKSSSTATTLSGYGITDAYTKTEVDTKLSSKATTATTLSGYGITDAKITNTTITLGSNSITPLTYDDKIKTVNMTATSATISANTFYVWGTVTSLSITLATPSDSSIYNEYMFQFTSGTSATTLSLPSTITWYQSNSTISANKTYQISIVNNLAVLGEF